MKGQVVRINFSVASIKKKCSWQSAGQEAHRLQQKFLQHSRSLMTNKQTFILANSQVRENTLIAVSSAPEGYVVTVAPKKRSLPQNNRLWAMLGDIAKQVKWHGRTMTDIQWKHFFSAVLLGQETVPNLDGTGFVVLGKATSTMSVNEMIDMQELMSAFGAERDVRWSDYA